MDDFCLCSPTQAYVPKDHAPPASADSLALGLLHWRESAALAFSILDKGLQSHRWPELFQVLRIREGLCVAHKLHHISTQVRRRRQDQLRHEHGALVLEQLLLVGRIVHVVHIDGDIDVKWLK